MGNSLHIPVADLAAAKAVTNYTDKMLMLIETLGLYRFDSELIVTSTDDTIIRPTNIANDTLAGRWVKMSSTITDHNLLSGLQGGTTGQYYHLTAAEAALLSGSALSKTDDTNITLTLSGSPSTALLRAVGIQVGWTGTLADARIASAANWNSKQAGHANLTSLSGLSYTSPAFVKMTAANTFALDTNTYLTANQTITLSGEASGSGTTSISTTIGANKVTLGMMAQVATQTFLGRTTAATGNVEALTITQAKSMLGVSTRVYRSVVNESPDNARVAFTISTASSILSASEEVYKNGMLMNVGAGNDYTISYGTTNTITFTSAPLTGDVILVNYSL